MSDMECMSINEFKKSADIICRRSLLSVLRFLHNAASLASELAICTINSALIWIMHVAPKVSRETIKSCYDIL